jgi:serine phosphatase RsbU (regulator of sigma subunit)/Tfp pilus assembly protein PilF
MTFLSSGSGYNVRKQLCIALLIFLRTAVFGGKADSLLRIIRGAGADTVKVKAMYQLGAELMDVKPDSADLMYRQALELARKGGDKHILSNALSNYGAFMFEKGFFSKALEYYLQRLAIIEETGDKKSLGRAYGQIGNVYIMSRDFEKALDYQKKALAIYQASDDKIWIGNTLNNIGVNYFNQKNLDSALAFFERARALREVISDKRGMASSLGNIGNVYAERKEDEKALEYMNRAEALHEELRNLSGQSLVLGNIGAVYVQMKDGARALGYLEKGLAIALKTGNLGNQQLIYDNLNKAYDLLGNTPKAFENYREFIRVRDTLSNQQTAEDITRLQLEYEFNKKTAMEKARQEKLDEVARQEARRQEVIRYLLIGGFVLLVAFVLFVFRSFRQQQASNRLLQAQKDEIEEQKKEIQDSIDYARLIQRSLLPSPAVIEPCFPGIFGLYRPKDVVSGDFYWFCNTRSHVYISAADCTGHGVPGAFMSSIGSEKLTEAVKDGMHTEPAQILAALNRGVRAALRQHEPGSRSRDGLDIALLRFDPDRKRVVYAGANRPLWIIRRKDGAPQLVEYKPVKSPIGGLTPDDAVYEQHVIDLLEGDRLYIFTDGFADQFGGGQERKFMTGRFRDLLLSIWELPMPEQEKALEKAHLEWRGRLEQTDDVLVIGIRV